MPLCNTLKPGRYIGPSGERLADFWHCAILYRDCQSAGWALRDDGANRLEQLGNQVEGVPSSPYKYTGQVNDLND